MLTLVLAVLVASAHGVPLLQLEWDTGTQLRPHPQPRPQPQPQPRPPPSRPHTLASVPTGSLGSALPPAVSPWLDPDPDPDRRSAKNRNADADNGGINADADADADAERAALIGRLVAVGQKHARVLRTRRVRERAWDTGITNVYRDLSYSVPISIGTPPQTLNVTIDTGSTTLWVYSDCDASACEDVTTFDGNSSSTYVSSNTPFVQNYGVGSVNGELGTDVVEIGGNAVPGQLFGLVSYTASDGVGALKGSTKSGLLGLGWPSGDDKRSWWESSLSHTTWDRPEFGIYLARELDHDRREFEVWGGVLTIGGTDPTLYTGSINYVPAVRDTTVYWQVPLGGVSVNGVRIPTANADGTAPLAIIDTGTTIALGARDTVAALYAQVPGARIDDTVTFSMLGYDAEVYTFPCTAISTLPRVGITLGGVEYGIYPPDLVIAINGTTCTGSLLGLESPDNIWLLGDTFLKNVYSVYRYDPPSVGFAPIAPGSDARYSTDDIQALAGGNTIYFDSKTDRSGGHFTSGTGERVPPAAATAGDVGADESTAEQPEVTGIGASLSSGSNMTSTGNRRAHLSRRRGVGAGTVWVAGLVWVLACCVP